MPQGIYAMKICLFDHIGLVLFSLVSVHLIEKWLRIVNENVIVL